MAKNGSKWQKTLSCSKSQKPYIIWLSFMAHICEMMISPSILFICSKFWFYGPIGFKMAKIGPKWQKILSNAPYQRNHTSYDCLLWCTCVKWYYLQVLVSIFQNFYFLDCQGVQRAKYNHKWQKILSVMPYISGNIYYLCLWYTCMYKRIISTGIFFIFSEFLIFWFFWLIFWPRITVDDITEILIIISSGVFHYILF